MRVVCKSFEDYLTCLGSLSDGEAPYQGVVRASNSEAEELESKIRIFFQSSAIVCVKTDPTFESQYLLEVGVDCGVDIRDSDPDHSGTNKATELREQLESLCKQNNWKILPGVIEI